MTLNYAVVVGQIRLVLYDDREASPTCSQVQEIVLGADPERYLLVRVPPLVWNGFVGLDQAPSILANCATEPHDPQEILRKDPHDPSIPYQWDMRQPGAV
jgi:dTDP-4-dehydrorhamnose 3,5-epimerase